MSAVKYIFILAAEHQLFQFKESLKAWSIEISQAIIIFYKLKSSEWIEKAVSEFDIKIYYIIEPWTFGSLVFRYKRFSKYYKYLTYLRKNYNIQTLFSSQYSSDYSLIAGSVFRNSQFVLLDEGTASFGVIELRKSSNRSRLIFCIKSIAYRLKISFPNSVIFFSQFNLPVSGNDELRRYTFKKVNNSIVYDKELVYFIGTSLVELDLLDEMTYVRYLTEIRSHFDSEKVVYFAHRKEEPKKLEIIERLGYEVTILNYPFEKYFSKLQVLPQHLCSFYSSTVFHLDNMFINNPEFIIYKIRNDVFRYNQKIIENIYTSLARQGFKIIELN